MLSLHDRPSLPVIVASSLRSRAPRWVKRIVWNLKARQFEHAAAPEPFVERLLSGLLPDSALLEYGCGSGNLLKTLRKRGWKGHYCGVDISEHAIEAARRTAGDPKAEWHASAIEDFLPDGSYDAICFVESIYYVHPHSLHRVLVRCVEHLAQSGRIYVRICDARRHADYLRFIYREFPQIIVVLPQIALSC